MNFNHKSYDETRRRPRVLRSRRPVEAAMKGQLDWIREAFKPNGLTKEEWEKKVNEEMDQREKDTQAVINFNKGLGI